MNSLSRLLSRPNGHTSKALTASPTTDRLQDGSLESNAFQSWIEEPHNEVRWNE